MPSGLPNVVVARESKPWWASRTLWINLFVLALAMAEQKLQFLQGVLPGNFYAITAFALPIVNVVLRSVTTAAVTLRRTDPTDPTGGAA